ncbi:hypothetical protein IT570_06510 [Candidatus Sumerlaeota bacterium]|nr:hypothetical protein [Candidatus Sumerlaeota bacterium]
MPRSLFAQPATRDAFFWWLGSRMVILCVFAFLSLTRPDSVVPRPLHLYDAEFYIDIAENGYRWNGDQTIKQNAAFFPLLPMVMRIIALAGAPADLSGTILSNLLFLFCLVAFSKLKGMALSRTELNCFYFLLSFHPASFYFSIPYTEAMYLLLAALVFITAERNKFLISALLCFFAGLVRSNGWICGGTLMATAAFRVLKGNTGWQAVRFPALAATMGAAGTLVFMGFCGSYLNDFMAPMHAQMAWGHRSLHFHEAIVSSIAGILREGDLMHWRILVDATWLVATLVVALLACVGRRLDAPLALFGVLSTLFVMAMLGGPEVRSTIRYQMVIFPTMAQLAIWCARWKTVRVIVGFVWVFLFLFFTGRVLLGEWVQ